MDIETPRRDEEEEDYPRHGLVSDGKGATRFEDVMGQFLEPGTELPPELLEEQGVVSLQPGDVVADRFEVVAPLGFGGMGAVYHVKDRQIHNEDKALKVMLPSLLRSETAQERFLSEVHISQNLRHDGIVTVYDLGEDKSRGFRFFTMEYIPGKTLHRVLKDRGGSVSVDEALDIALQVCGALKYAHQYTIHRDLKPQNIMVRPDGKIKLLDFGLAELMSPGRMTKSSMALGTAYYQAPEQSIQPGELDQRADIYSLGIILYQMLTGMIPAGHVKPPSREDSSVPKSLDCVVMQCLERKPEERHQSIDALRVKLDACVKARFSAGLRRTAEVIAVVLFVVGTSAFGAYLWLRPMLATPQETFERAKAMQAGGRYADASETFQRFAEANPYHVQHAEAQFLAAYCLQLVPSDSFDAKQARNTRALDLFDRFVKDHPAHAKVPRARIYMGILDFEVGRYENAIELLRDPTLPQRDPEGALPALRTLARARLELGQYKEAVSAYLQAASLTGNYTADQDYEAIGDLYRRQADRVENGDERRQLQVAAVENWTKALRMPTVDPAATSNIREKRRWLSDQLGISGDETTEQASVPKPQEEAVQPGPAPVPPDSQSQAREPGQTKAPAAVVLHQPAPAPNASTSSLKPGEARTFSGIEMVWVPPGEFMMGSPESEAQRDADEAPRHQVRITKGFWLGKYEVTQAQWQSVMGNNPSSFKGDDRLPVGEVSWDDCQEFIRKLNARGEEGFRLPAEAEWEYACRAGTTTPFSFGETISTEQANYDGNSIYGSGSKGQYREKTMPAGTFRPNAWDLYDMHGNVWEWCQDWYHDSYDGAPTDGIAWELPVGQYRVLRGGSWNYAPSTCRCASRLSYSPDGRYVGVAFRLARTQD